MNPTTMQTAVESYLKERRDLGFDLRISGRLLLHFARYADRREPRGPLTVELQLAWIRDEAHRATPITWARRVEILRPFIKYYRQFDPETSVLDSTHFGRGHRRLTPHIYTDGEIADLLHEAGRLQPTGLRPATYQTLFGLLAAAGLRLSEATRLREADVDLAAGTLTVQETKFKKSRLLPLHPTTVDALSRYRVARNRVVLGTSDSPFFVGSECHALPHPTIHGVFAGLRHILGWVARGGHPRPRLHDLRHTFAVRRVQLWQQGEVPTDQGMFWLSTYLGHASITNTYWYLTGVPDLMQLVGTQFAQFAFQRRENRETADE